MKTKHGSLAGYYRQRYPLTFAAQRGDSILPILLEEGWRVAREAAQVLKQDFGASKVAVFGSLTEPSRFNQWSDVDLAVWGVPDDRFYAAVAAVISLTSNFKVDLVDAEDCKEFLQKAIERQGVEV